MLEYAWRNEAHILGDDEVASLQHGVCLCRLHHGNRGTRRSTQQHSLAGARLLHDVHNIVNQRRVDIYIIYITAEVSEFLLSDYRLDVTEFHEVEVSLVQLHYLLLFCYRRIAHGYLHKEAVELSLGQFVCTLLLHRVLCGDDGEEVVHLICYAVYAHLFFFHHFEERRLRLCRCAVYLVNEHNVRKDGSLVEVELRVLHVEHRRSEHVARHEVGSELYSAEAGVHQSRHQSCRECLCHSWHSLDEHMTVGKHRGEDEVNRLVLSYNHSSYLFSQLLYFL